MPASLLSATTFRAAAALLILTASAADFAVEDGSALAEDMALHLIQSRSAMTSGPRQVLRREAVAAAAAAVAPEGFDATIFAQTAVDISPAEPPEGAPAAGGVEPPAEGARPVWLPGGPSEAVQPDEDAMCSLEGLTPGVCAMAALARAPAAAAAGGSQLDFVDPKRLERALFEELEAALAGTHGGFSTAHLATVEEGLGGLFAALPKNGAGRLDHPTVRYAVHQHFLRGHAWYLRSLNPVGEAQTPASPGEALRGQVPLHLQRLIEEREGGRGLGLRELAALAATLGHLIEGDMVERLKAAYRTHGLEPNSTAGGTEVLEALKTYMAHFLSLEHKSGYAVTPEQARAERQTVESGFDWWPKLSEMMREAVAKRAAAVSFPEAVSVAKEVMADFELVSAQDCQVIKRDLSAISKGATGRVLLADFHRKALEGPMLFAESTEYLATLGALEKGKGGAVNVLVPNYVYSPSNCLGTTSFFDMCCPNECEAILQRLELQLRKPEATPAEVEGVVELVHGRDGVSHAALEELDELAHGRDGLVPLHGYHFAAWLHRAFPGECPRPRPEDFAGARGHSEVPAAEREFQAVAALPFVEATRSELLAELALEQEEGEGAPAEEEREGQERREDEEEEEEKEPEEGALAPRPVLNASLAMAAGAGTDLRAEELKALAARRLGTGGLKLAAGGLDAASLAQTRLDVSPAAEEERSEAAEGSRVEGRGASGLNIKRRREL